jgi:hypothetical protein
MSGVGRKLQYSQENKEVLYRKTGMVGPGVYEDIKNGLSITGIVRGGGYYDPGVTGR